MPKPRIWIRNGRLIDPANQIDEVRDVFIAKGKIVSTSAKPDGFNADVEIDASDKIVCPGFIDLCGRLREPGEEHKASIASETKAAAAGGITTLCVPPDTSPVIDTPSVADSIRQRVRQYGFVRVLPIGALTRKLDGSRLSEMAALKEAGCIGVTNLLQPMENPLVLRRALEYAATHDLVVFVHPQDHWLKAGGCMHEGRVSTRLGLPGIPTAAETTAVAFYLALVEQIGVHVHFCRLSSARAVRMIARAQHNGLPITADVCAHQLHFTEDAIANFEALYHVEPPFRTEQDKAGLRLGLREGVVKSICSDHQPQDLDAKLAPFPDTEPGMSSFETLLPLSLAIATEEEFSLSDMIAHLTTGPAKALQINLGTLSNQVKADVCIFDPKQQWLLTSKQMHSRGHNTPMMNQTLTGRVTHSIFEGQLVFSL